MQISYLLLCSRNVIVEHFGLNLCAFYNQLQGRNHVYCAQQW